VKPRNEKTQRLWKNMQKKDGTGRIDVEGEVRKLGINSRACMG